MRLVKEREESNITPWLQAEALIDTTVESPNTTDCRDSNLFSLAGVPT